MKGSGTTYPVPVVTQLLDPAHLLGSMSECVTAFCYKRAPDGCQESQVEAEDCRADYISKAPAPNPRPGLTGFTRHLLPVENSRFLPESFRLTLSIRRVKLGAGT